MSHSLFLHADRRSALKMVCLMPRCPFSVKFLNRFLCKCKKQLVPSEFLPPPLTNPDLPTPPLHQEVDISRPVTIPQIYVGIWLTILIIYGISFVVKQVTKRIFSASQSNPPSLRTRSEEELQNNSEQGEDIINPSDDDIHNDWEENIEIPDEAFMESVPHSLPEPIPSPFRPPESCEEPREEKPLSPLDNLPIEPLQPMKSPSDRNGVVPCILFPRPYRSRSEATFLPAHFPVASRRSSIAQPQKDTGSGAVYYRNVTFTWKQGGHQVYLSGSFFNWDSRIPLVLDTKTSEHTVSLILQNGRYEYKFIVDREWQLAPEQPTCDNRIGTLNHCITV